MMNKSNKTDRDDKVYKILRSGFKNSPIEIPLTDIFTSEECIRNLFKKTSKNEGDECIDVSELTLRVFIDTPEDLKPVFQEYDRLKDWIIERIDRYERELVEVKPLVKNKQHIDIDPQLFWEYLVDKYKENAIQNVLSEDVRKYIEEYVRHYHLKYSRIFAGGNEPLIRKSLVFGLFELYGDEFPGETEEYWFDRWINDPERLEPFNVETRYSKDNNLHLILTILYAVHKIGLEVDIYEDYVFNRWGIKDYHTKISRYVENSKNRDVIPHSEAKNIKALIRQLNI